MKILIHSNGPLISSGYGIQTALLAKQLKAAGHDVAISAFVGQRTGTAKWEGMTVYPEGHDTYGNDVIHQHALHHFGGDPLGGWIITLMDVFGLTNPLLDEFNVAAWCPVDHFPLPPDVSKFFERTGAIPIAMSRFGEDMLKKAGLDPFYAPLSVDLDVFSPCEPDIERAQGKNARALLGIPDTAFMVMMNAMNKSQFSFDRKGFHQAIMGFARFARTHPDAVLYMHSEQLGKGGLGINLDHLALRCGIPDHQIVFADQYAYHLGIPNDLLAAYYTTADVLLAPSMGEGFCLPLVEAQACGTPVIISDFSAQPELLGAGWAVDGQPWYDPHQTAWVFAPNIESIEQALGAAYDADRGEMIEPARATAAHYETGRVFQEHWQPVLAKMEGNTEPLELDRGPLEDVAVLVPCLNRPGNVGPLVASHATNSAFGTVYFVCDEGDTAQIEAVRKAGGNVLISDKGSTFAQKINSGFSQTLEPWVFVTGDDVRFQPGWVEAAAKLAGRFDVIGTNDTTTGQGNPRVQAGVHADHFFVRRAYVDKYGGCLDGPGVVCHGYRHFYSDVETVELAKARGVFAPCLDSVVEHFHPDFGKAEVDATYQLGWGQRDADLAEWQTRQPLVEMQREGLGKVRAA